MSNDRSSEPLSAPLTAAVRQMVHSMGLEAPADEVAEALKDQGVNVTPAVVSQVQANLASGAVESSGKAQREWVAHEQHADRTTEEAQRLLQAAGSKERAHEAVEEAIASNAADPPTDRLAKELGFSSYLDLFESSQPLGAQEQKAWLLTSLQGGQWVIWNDRDLKVEGSYSTQDDAMAAGRARFSAAGAQQTR